jgi:hypothetical protein
MRYVEDQIGAQGEQLEADTQRPAGQAKHQRGKGGAALGGALAQTDDAQWDQQRSGEQSQQAEHLRRRDHADSSPTMRRNSSTTRGSNSSPACSRR